MESEFIMPYVRIALAAGKPSSWLRAISASLQKALEESFEVPVGDCFQVFQQCQAGELVFDREYLSDARSDDFILFHITAGRARSTACKRAFLQSWQRAWRQARLAQARHHGGDHHYRTGRLVIRQRQVCPARELYLGETPCLPCNTDLSCQPITTWPSSGSEFVNGPSAGWLPPS
jgi:hypothetical protein